MLGGKRLGIPSFRERLKKVWAVILLFQCVLVILEELFGDVWSVLDAGHSVTAPYSVVKHDSDQSMVTLT